VSIIERLDDLRLIALGQAGKKEMVHIFSYPYEQLCKENLSFLSKYFNMVKLGEGLDFSLRGFGFGEDKPH